MGVKKGGAKGKGGGGGGGGGGKAKPKAGDAASGVGGRTTPTPGAGLLPPPDKGGAPHPADATAIADSIAKVKPAWEEMPPTDRAALLSLPVAELEARAAAAAAAEAAADAAEAAAEAAAGGGGGGGDDTTASASSSAASTASDGDAAAAAATVAEAAALAPPTPDGAEAPRLMPPGAIDTYDGDAAGAVRALKEGVARLRAARARAAAEARSDDDGPSTSGSPPGGGGGAAPLPSYKVWKWPPTGATFPDAASFRRFVVDTLIPPELREHLPPVDEPPASPGGPPRRTPESPAEAALRGRMTTLLARIHAAQAGTGPLPSEAAAYEEAEAAAAKVAKAHAALNGGKAGGGKAGGGKAGGGRSGKAPPPATEPPPPATASIPAGRDINAAIAADVLGVLAGEHEFVYAPIAGPVAAFVCAALPPARRLSTPSDLAPEDLERCDPDDALRVLDWVVERVDTLAGKVRNDADEIKEMEAKAAARAAKRAAGGEAAGEDEDEDDDDAIGDVDLFTLDEAGTALTVNPAWLRHLQSRVLGEDAQPRPSKPGEDPHKCGLTLEWVFGSIVCTAEKARDAAKRGLGGWAPTAEAAADRLRHGLAEQAAADQRLKGGRALLAEMLAARKKAAELGEQGFDLRLSEKVKLDGTPVKVGEPTPPVPAALPDAVCLEMCRREEVLTRAKLAVLAGTRRAQEKRARAARAAHRTAEPEFERARRVLEEVKASPRPAGAAAAAHHHHGDGRAGPPHARPAAGGGLAFRTAAEMERHKAAVTEAALADQVEAQSAVAAAQARFVATQRELHTAAAALTRTEQELKQLATWHNSVRSLVLQFEAVLGGGAPEDAVAGMKAARLAPSVAGPPPPGAAPALAGQAAAWAHPSAGRLREYFHNDVRKQMYTTADDITFFNGVRADLASAAAAKADGAAGLAHIEAALCHLACDDPGGRIGAALALPAIQSRLLSAAMERADRLAADNEAAVLDMVAAETAAEAAEAERRARARAKARERERGARARAAAAAAEAAAAARAERAAAEAAAAAAAAEAAAARERAAAEAKAAEEAMLAARRAELMSGTDEESAHWRARSAAAAAEAALRRGELVALGGNSDDGGGGGGGSLAPGTPTGGASSRGGPAPATAPAAAAAAAPGEECLPARPPSPADLAGGAGAGEPLLAFGSVPPPAAPAGVVLGVSGGPPPPPTPKPAGAAPSGGVVGASRLRVSAPPFVPGPPRACGAPAPPLSSPSAPAAVVPALAPATAPRATPLPRGLVNATGRNNCFLNAVVQGLAACPAVPAALARLPPAAALEAAGGPPADVAVLAALRTVLASLAARPPPAAGAVPDDGAAAPPAAVGLLPPDAAAGAAAAAAAAAARPPGEPQPSPPSVRRRPCAREVAAAVNPARLRAALGVLGGAATGCEASDMADAAEVLGELLASVHRAEAAAAVGGSGGGGGGPPADPLLPTRRTVPAGVAPPPAAPPTAAVRLFGMEVALPSPPDGDSSGRRSGGSATSGDSGAAAAAAADGFQPAGGGRQARGRGSSGLYASASSSPPEVEGAGVVLAASPPPGGPGPAAPSTAGGATSGSEVASPPPVPAAASGSPAVPLPAQPAPHQAVLQFVKFFHLAPAAAVRSAAERLVAASASAAARFGGPAPTLPPFEQVLALAEAAVNGGGGGGDGAAAVPSPPPGPSAAPSGCSDSPPVISAATLLARPAIVTVALVWESARAADAAITAVTAAIGTTLDAGGVFGGGGPPGPRYALRAAVCYLGHHYHSYVRAGAAAGAPPEAGCWLLADDETIAPVGGWGDAVAAMRADRAQPCLLFYEELSDG